jgi:hypothetical protein
LDARQLAPGVGLAAHVADPVPDRDGVVEPRDRVVEAVRQVQLVGTELEQLGPLRPDDLPLRAQGPTELGHRFPMGATGDGVEGGSRRELLERVAVSSELA